jgi:ATP-dependent Clp protease ATP-binding subunit ClpB
MLKDKEITLDVSNEAKDWLAQLGYDVNYGARPLKREIQKYLINPLSQELLAGNFIDGDTIKVSVGEKAGLMFDK